MQQQALSLPRGPSTALKGPKAVRLENERIYGQPLPWVQDKSWISYILSTLNLFPKPYKDERVIGVLDTPSCSVWVHDEEHQMILWRRGFFGKGSLSRSEPTWLKREINRLRVEKSGGKGVGFHFCSLYNSTHNSQNLLPRSLRPSDGKSGNSSSSREQTQWPQRRQRQSSHSLPTQM